MPRRDFLKGAGVGLAMASAAVGEASQGEPAVGPNDRLGWAVLGLGDFATNEILPSFGVCGRSKLTGLVSGSPAKSRKLAARYGVPESNIYNYENFDAIAENPAIDVVYVITPNATHKEFAIRAARAGKHVMCEKPMAPTSADCEAMIAACRDAGRKLMIAYRAQFDPFNREATRLCRSGELGRLVSFLGDHGRILDPSQPQDQWRTRKALAGGGSLVDIGIYNLNAARFLTGEEPVEVSARMHSPDDDRFREVEETMHFALRFPSGCLANCASSYGWSGVKRYRMIGEKGWVDLDPATEYFRHRLIHGRDKGQETKAIDEENQFALEIDHLSESILAGKEPKTPGEEGLRDVRIIEAIYEAARTGSVIKL